MPNVIILPKNPTAKNLSNAITQRFDLETSNNSGLQWQGPDEQDAAQMSIKNAYTGALDLVKTIEDVVKDAPTVLQPLIAPYQQVWFNWLGSIILNGSSTDTRRLAIHHASSQIGTKWQSVQSDVQSASDPNAAVKDALNQFGQALSFVNSIGTVAINIPLASYTRAATSRLYPGTAWSSLTSDERDIVTVTSLQEAGLTGVSEAINVLGDISLGVSVILAFWQSSDNAHGYFSKLSTSLVDIGAGQVGGNLTSKAISNSDAGDVLLDTFGSDADLLTAVIPTGFGLVVGLVFTALADLIMNLIFGADQPPSPNLVVSLTVPLTTSTS
jgi:hypothetical protein